jgi:acyl-CoA thioester hydrolase
MPVTTAVRVRYAETDQMSIVYYANYFVWFEIGRVELLRSLGLTYNEMETEHRCILPVVEANCRYRAPARYDDEILIETSPVLLRQHVIKFAYRILRKETGGAEPTLLAEGETAHVVCDENLIKREIPERYAVALRSMMV